MGPAVGLWAAFKSCKNTVLRINYLIQNGWYLMINKVWWAWRKGWIVWLCSYGNAHSATCPPCAARSGSPRTAECEHSLVYNKENELSDYIRWDYSHPPNIFYNMDIVYMIANLIFLLINISICNIDLLIDSHFYTKLLTFLVIYIFNLRKIYFCYLIFLYKIEF